VRALYDGAQVISEVTRFEPEVILCDLGMPVVTGFDVARQIRSRFKDRNITLIAATGYGRPEDVENAKAAGFDRHLVKPVDLNDLQRLIRAAPHTPKSAMAAGRNIR
jgi:CheY-like chemotaxis protein